VRILLGLRLICVALPHPAFNIIRQNGAQHATDLLDYGKALTLIELTSLCGKLLDVLPPKTALFLHVAGPRPESGLYWCRAQ